MSEYHIWCSFTKTFGPPLMKIITSVCTCIFLDKYCVNKIIKVVYLGNLNRKVPEINRLRRWSSLYSVLNILLISN